MPKCCLGKCWQSLTTTLATDHYVIERTGRQKWIFLLNKHILPASYRSTLKAAIKCINLLNITSVDGFGGIFLPDCVLGPSELSFHKSVCNELCYCQGYHLAVWQRLRSNKWSQRGEAHLKRTEGRLAQKFYQQHPSAISSLLSPCYLFWCYVRFVFSGGRLLQVLGRNKNHQSLGRKTLQTIGNSEVCWSIIWAVSNCSVSSLLREIFSDYSVL